ncbi:hypothetical protein BH09SUM1_BH09SUM1_04360 [soil metagenome]
MKNFRPALLIFTAALFLATTLLFAAAPIAVPKSKTRISPHDATSTNIDGNRVSIFYGRPYSKDPKSGETRKIWGGLVPFGAVWRTGADEATTLITQKQITLGGTAVAAGAYTLFTLPNEDGSAELIISKQMGQWGLQYDENQDLARVALTADGLTDNVDQFTMIVTKTDDEKVGAIKMLWEKKQYSVTYSVTK